MLTTLDSNLEEKLNDLDLPAVLGGAVPALLQRRGELLAIKELSSGRYAHVNAAMAEFLRRPVAQILGYTDTDIFEASVSTVLRAAEHTAMAQPEPLHSDHRFEWGGERREFTVLRMCVGLQGQVASAQASPGKAGEGWLLSVWHDVAPERLREGQLRAALEQIEQQQRANEMLRREIADQAMRDPASGLYRRAHFEDQLRREVDLSTREHREFAIVFIEMDPAGQRVQALGAAGENAMLQAMGRLLRGGTRAMDASCRYDDRRFAVLLSGVGLATAHTRMEGLRRKCEAQIVVHEGQEVDFSVSIGVASFPHTAQSQEALLQACTAALREASRRGGNQVTLAAISLDAAAG